MTSCTPNSGFLNASAAANLSRTSPLVWSEICAIQQAILAASTGQEKTFCATISGNTPFTFYTKVDSVDVISGGTNYKDFVPHLEMVLASNDTFFDSDDIFLDSDVRPAIINAVINSAGEVVATNIVDGGIGYISADYLNMIHTAGEGFSADVELSEAGSVSAVSITSSGEGYLPALVEANIVSSTGSGAVLDVVLSETGSILRVDVINKGYNYTTGDTVQISAQSGSGAVLKANISVNPYGTDPHQYYLAYTRSVSDKVRMSHLNQVIEYFKGLGYSLKLSENSVVPGILAWNVCWC